MHSSRFLILCLSLLVTTTLVMAHPIPANGNGPADLPALLQQAIDGKDSDLAISLLDTDALVRSFLEKNLPWINSQVQQGKILLNPPLAVALATLNTDNAVARRMVNDFLALEMRKFITYGIESGSFAGRPRKQEELVLLDGGVFALLGQISTARKEFSGTTILQQEENSALIRTALFDAGTGTAYPLDLALRKDSGFWRVTGVENTEELTRRLRPLSTP